MKQGKKGYDKLDTLPMFNQDKELKNMSSQSTVSWLKSYFVKTNDTPQKL